MGINDGVIDEEVLVKFSAFMEANNIPFDCPQCGTERTAARHFVTPSQMYGSGQVQGTVYPMIMLICGSCARTEFFSAVVVGFYDSDQAAKK